MGNIQVVPSLQDMKTGAIIEPSTKSIQFNAAADELPTVNMEFIVQDVKVEEKK